MLPDPDLKPKRPWDPLKTMINNLRSIAGVDPYNRDRILKTDLAGNLQVVIASGLGVLQKEYCYWYSGSLSVQSGVHRFTNLSGADLQFKEVKIVVNTPPTGADIIVDVHLSGNTIFASANRPYIYTGTYAGSSTFFNIKTFPYLSYITFDIDQVGSSVAGSNLVITVVAG